MLIEETREYLHRLQLPEVRLHPRIRQALVFGLAIVALPLAVACSQDNSVSSSNPDNPPKIYFPYSKSEIKKWNASQGWKYDKNELEITGLNENDHHGVDIVTEPKAPRVLAPMAGYATVTFQKLPMQDKQNNLPYRTYKGIPNEDPLTWGFGIFVTITDEQGWSVQLAHLNEVSDNIPFANPTKDTHPEIYNPRDHNLTVEELKQPGKSIKVNVGDVIGRVGNSGLARGWGQNEYKPGDKKISPGFNSWDIEHLHIELFKRSNRGKVEPEKFWLDVFDLYTFAEHYPSSENSKVFGPKNHFMFGKNGDIAFAGK